MSGWRALNYYKDVVGALQIRNSSVYSEHLIVTYDFMGFFGYDIAMRFEYDFKIPTPTSVASSIGARIYMGIIHRSYIAYLSKLPFVFLFVSDMNCD